MDFYLHAQRAAKPMAVNALQAFCVNSAQKQCVNISTSKRLTIQNQTNRLTSRKPAPLPLCRSNRNNRRTLSQNQRSLASGKYSGQPFTLQDQFELLRFLPPRQEYIPACGIAASAATMPEAHLPKTNFFTEFQTKWRMTI